jgi:hypothetical protein
MTSFESATALTLDITESDGASFWWEVPDGWQQGRGAWGGLVVGAAVRAAVSTEPDATRSVRTLSLQISGPALVGRHRVRVRASRIGSRMSTWAVAVSDAADAVVATAMVITGLPRRGAADQDEATWSPLTAPPIPPVDEVPLLSPGPPFPVFTQHFAYGAVDGLPLQGGQAETLGWIGYREASEWTDVTLLALVDAWFTATLVPLSDFAPVGTVNFTANVTIDPAGLTHGEPLIHHGLVSGSRDGYASELRRLWTSDGRLAVENVQTTVVG